MERRNDERCGKGKDSIRANSVKKNIREGLSLEREMIKQLSKAELLSVLE